jgi:hypothetical protein
MWKVKRMNTAPIVVVATADGAGGIAAYLANRSDTKQFVAKPAAHGADVMAAVLPTCTRAPSLTETLK